MMARGRLLRVSNHLEIIRDRLWAINGVLLDADLRALKEPELEEWVIYAGVAIMDVQGLLDKILDWQPGEAAAASNLLSRCFLGNRVVSRQAILVELKETAYELNYYLVRRASALGLWKDKVNSMDPREE